MCDQSACEQEHNEFNVWCPWCRVKRAEGRASKMLDMITATLRIMESIQIGGYKCDDADKMLLDLAVEKIKAGIDNA